MHSTAENISAGIEARGIEFFVNPQQLVVFGKPVRTRQRSSLDLAGIGRDRKVGDEAVLGFTAAVRDDDAEAGLLRHLDGLQCFGQRADLVHLHQNGVGGPGLEAARQPHRGW